MSGDNSGQNVYSYTLTSHDGRLQAVVSEYGARLLRLCVMVNGEMRDVVQGFDTLESYENAEGYLGAVVGRFGNRICRGRFTLDGKDYTLFCNDGENHLHGGECGFDKKVWQSSCADGDEPWVTFTTLSPDGDEGYPGNLNVSVTYTLTRENGIRIDYLATTDKKTVIGLTNHAYFNLAGEGDIGSHTISIDADRYLPTDRGLIPTGEIRDVTGTAFDFREYKKVSCALESDDGDIEIGGGVDHCLIFSSSTKTFQKRVSVVSPSCDLEMSVYTDRPCVQFYTGNFLGDPRYPFRNGVPQQRRHAFCLETEGMPDAINHPDFLDCTLAPGTEWRTSTEYRFEKL